MGRGWNASLPASCFLLIYRGLRSFDGISIVRFGAALVRFGAGRRKTEESGEGKWGKQKAEILKLETESHGADVRVYLSCLECPRISITMFEIYCGFMRFYAV